MQNLSFSEKSKESLEKDIESLIHISQELEKDREKDISKFAELISEFLEKLEVVSHAEISPDVDVAYKKMQEKNLLLRVENISRIINSITKKESYEIGNEEDHYANSVVPNTEGVKIAFAEGRAPGPVRLLMGFDVRSAIAIDPNQINVHPIDKIDDDLRDTKLRSMYCRHLQGVIRPEYIKYIVLRVPRKIFPESKLTKTELLNNSMYIFRSIELN